MPNNKELFEQKMNALANSINTKANTSGAKTIDQLKTAVDGIVSGGYTITENTYGDTIDILGSAIYSITANITNGTASGATTILPNGTATITITANSGYNLPADVSVTNATKGTFVEGVLTISNPTGNVTISATCTELLNKGDLIEVDMTGSGTPQLYRIIKKVGDNVVEVLGMTKLANSRFATSGQTYVYSDLDNYLNYSWYNTLSSTAKTAIVDKTFRQDSWYMDTTGNPDYQGKANGGASYQISLSNASFGNEITKHCYALSVQDVLDYLEVTPQMTQSDTTLTATNIWQMYWKSDVAVIERIWLRSASASNASYAMVVYGNSGVFGHYGTTNNIAVRPAFQIDLSKIEWSKHLVDKGQLINIDMDGDGTAEEYRVIKKVDGGVVEVLGIADLANSQFATSGQTYENNALDTYLNSTWYNTLSSTAKSAIVDKTLRQDSWYPNTSGNPVYQGISNMSYQVSLSSASFGNEITRHVYALSVQDILTYLEVTPEMTTSNTTLTSTNLWQMYWKSNVAVDKYVWLRSANASNASYVIVVYGGRGGLLGNGASYNNAVHPSFQIDLSKISWTPSN